jgi:hypothetical protein
MPKQPKEEGLTGDLAGGIANNAARVRAAAQGLRYVGDGSAFPDIPARDLSDTELAEVSQRLIAQAERELAERLFGDDEEKPALPTFRSIRQLLLDSGLYVEAPIAAPPAPAESEG